MTSVQLSIPNPLGGDYSSTGLKKDFSFKDMWSTGVIGRIRQAFSGSPPARVVEKGGEYRLQRSGAGTLRLDAIAKHGIGGARTRVQPGAQVGGGHGVSGHGASHGSTGTTGTHGTTGTSSAHSAPQTPQQKVQAFQDGLAGMRQRIGDKARQVTELGQEAANPRLDQARGRSVALQHGRGQLALERELMAELGKLKDVGAAIEHLPESDRVAARAQLQQARDFLTTKLIGVRMPGVAAMLEKLPTAPDGGASLAGATGRTADQLRQRYADASHVAEDGGLHVDRADLIDDPARFATELRATLGLLAEHDLLKPELLHRLADQPQMRDWSSVGARAGESAETRTLRNLDATVMLLDELKALTSGNAKTIDFLLGKDSRLDQYALDLKKAFRQHGTSDREIETRHTLTRSWDTLKNALEPHRALMEKTFPLGMQTLFNPSGTSEIRMDARLLAGLAKFAQELGKSSEHAELARQVNLLTANMMLLEQDLDAQLPGARIQDLRDEVGQRQDGVTAALTALETGGPPRFRGEGRILDSTDAALLERRVPAGGGSVRENLELLHKTAGMEARLSQMRAEIDDLEWQEHDQGSAGDKARDKMVSILSRQAGELERAVTANRDKLAPFLDAFGGRAQRDDTFDRLTPLAVTVTELGKAERELALAEGNRRLGLGDADLRAAGFSEAEIADFRQKLASGSDAEYRDAIKALGGQGLGSTGDAGKVTASINAIMKRIVAGSMTQDAMQSLGRSDPEGRANLVRDLFLQDITRQPGNFQIGDRDAAVAINAGMHAFHAGLQDFDHIIRVYGEIDMATGDHRAATQRVVDASNKLTKLDTDCTLAQRKLEELGRELGFTSDKAKPKGLALAHDLQQAVQTERLLTRLEEEIRRTPRDTPERALLEADARTASQQLTTMLGRLKHLDPATMSHSIFSRGPATREALVQFATPKRLEAAQQIITIRETPAQKQAAKTDAEAGQRAADAILAQRKTLLGPSHGVLTGAIRAAIAEARQASGQPVDSFDPAEHRAAIEERLKGWGIDPSRYTPEIDDALHGTFDAATIERWIDQSKKSLSSREVQAEVTPGIGGKLANVGRRIGAHFTGTRHIDLATRLAMVDTIKGLRVGERMTLSGGDGLKLATGKIPIEMTGTVKASAEAFGREKKLLEVMRTPHGWEVFFKTGSEGGFKLGVSADIMKLVDVGVSGGYQGARLTGAGLRFASEDDVTAFLERLTSGDPVTPKDWSRSKEALLVTDRTHKVAGGAEASVSTKSVGEFLESIGVDAQTGIDTVFGGHGDLEVWAGVSLEAEGGKEWRTITESNAERVVIERERTSESAVTAKLGLYVTVPTPQDYLVDGLLERSGALDRMDSGLRSIDMGLPREGGGERPEGEGGEGGEGAEGPSHGENAHSGSSDQHMWNPAGATTHTPLSVSASLHASKRTSVDAVAFRHDGLLDEGGTSMTRTMVLGGGATMRTLATLGPDLSSEETGEGQVDELLKALQDDQPIGDTGVGFRAGVSALLGRASKGDKLQVVYDLKPDARAIINDHIKSQQEMTEQLRSAKGRGDTREVGRLEGQIKAEKAFVKKMMERESNYAPSQVRLIANSSVKSELSVLGLTVLSWNRVAEGEIERDTLTVDIPGGPAELAKKAGHGHHGGGHVGHGPQGGGGHQPQPHVSGGVSGGTTGTTGSTSVSGSTGHDTLASSNGHDTVSGSSGHDTIAPSGGHDTLAGSGGGDQHVQLPVTDQVLGGGYAAGFAARLGSPGRIADGNGFYAERQDGHRCLMHSVNAYLGGQAFNPEEINRFLAHRHAQTGGHGPAPTVDAGGETFEVEAVLNFLNAQGLTPTRVESRVLAPEGLHFQPGYELPDLDSDRAVFLIQGSHAVDGADAPHDFSHFVTFRKDEAGDWWLVDSRGVEAGQLPPESGPGLGPRHERITPQAWLDRVIAQPGVGITMLGITTEEGTMEPLPPEPFQFEEQPQPRGRSQSDAVPFDLEAVMLAEQLRSRTMTF